MKKLVQKIVSVLALVVAVSARAAVPAAPANVQQAWLVTESLLLWDAVPDATGYNVYRADHTNTAWTLVGTSTVPRFRDPGLQWLPSFYFVTAVNAGGESTGSEPGTVQFAEPFTITVAEPQTALNTLSPTNAILGVATSAADGAQGLVDWGLDATNFTGFLLNTNYLPVHQFELTNLSPRTVYYYRLTSITSNRAGLNFLGSFATPDTNHPPFAEDWSYPWPLPAFTVSLGLHGYDSNQPPLALTFRIVTPPTNGTLSEITPSWWNANEAWVDYTPAPGARGAEHFQFVVNNGVWDSAPALVTLTNWFNTPPATTNGFLTTAEDTPVAFTLPQFDAEGDPVTFVFDSWSALNGTVSGTPPHLVFTPATNFSGTAWFGYWVNDGYEQIAGSFSIEVTPVNDAPVIDATFTTPAQAWEDWAQNLPVYFTDTEGDSTYEIILVSAPAHGTATVENGQLRYLGATNYFGPDSLVVAVRESDGTTSAPVTIEVNVQSMNDAPAAQDQDVTTTEDTALVITPTATDVDSSNFTFRVKWLGEPAHGWVEETGTNFIYHPATDYFGSDEFQFEVFDDQNWLGWPATIRIQVTPVAELNKPENLRRRTYAGDGLVRLWWQEVPGAAYNVYRADGTNAPFTLLAGGVTTTNFQDPSALWQQPYFYRVTATDAGLEGPASDTAFVMRDDTGTLTLNQQFWLIHATTGRVQFASSLVGGVEGIFEHGTDRSYGVFLENTNLLGVQHFNLSNLTPATVYYFRITATDAKGNAVVVSTNYFQDWFSTEVPPVANAQSVTATEDTARAITLAGSDPNSIFHPLTYAIVTAPSHGTLTMTGPNTCSYLPATNYAGTDSFTFRVNNGELNSTPATVSLNVTPVNDSPVAANISLSTAEDTSRAIAPVFTDVDGGPSLLVQIVTPPARGVAGVSGTNLMYLPATNFVGADSFTYRISDGFGFGNTATVSLNVTNINDAPVGTNISFTTPEDTAFTLRPTMLGFDPETNFFVVQLVAGAANGTVTVSGTNLLYTPATNYHGTDSFTVRLSDGAATSANIPVNLTVTAVNDRPVANNQSVTAAEDTAKAITLIGSDVDGNPLTYTVLSGPAQGALSGSGAACTYTPALNYSGPDSFTFLVNDGSTNSATATVSITVTAVNDAPVANALALTLPEDGATNFTLTASDVDSGALTFTVLAGPANGTLTGIAPNLSYIPPANFSGTDTVQFSVSDGALSATNTVSLTVLPVNDAPVANAQSLNTDEDSALAVTLTSFDADGDTLTYLIITGPTNGTLNTSASANVIYTPATNFSGADSFVFQVSDGSTSSTATVSLTVTPVNDAPVANAQSVSLAEDTSLPLTLTGLDVENDALTYDIVTGPANGALTGSGANRTYTPAANFFGTDSFTFRVNDGSSNSAVATINVTVMSVNDAPVANAQSRSTAEDTALALTLTGSDLENDALTYVVVTGPASGTLTGSGANRTYTPAANFFGADSFTFRVNDGSSNSALATVSLTVTPVNDAPVANAQSLVTLEDTALPVTLTGADAETANLIYTVITLPAYGSVNVTNSANLAYTPVANYFGADSFTFRVSDGTNTSTATVSLTITSVNDAPVANTQAVTVIYNTAKTITLTGSDLEGSTLTYAIVSGPTNGALSGTAPNLTYTPNVGSAGADWFTFRVNDGGSNSAPATVTINTLNPAAIPPAPTALAVTVPTALGTLILNWSCTATNEDGFKVERSLNGSSGWSQIATAAINIHTFTNTGLTSNTRYYYRVRSYNRLGHSAYSGTVNAKAR